MSDIALIGMACRFPGANNHEAYWQLLSQGRHAILTLDDTRWDMSSLFDPEPGQRGKTYALQAGLIDDVDRFDAECFGISAIEAERMDPQQRILLEVTRDAFEDAGLTKERLAGTKTGVFIGISTFDYTRLLPRTAEFVDLHWGTGTSIAMAANRLSYVFDLRGPSQAIDTACSSSLVALHTACLSLRAGDSDAALVGGVNLMLSPELMIAFSAARMMAPDGRCKAFDDRADGYVRGEGCGAVVLKRLQDAEVAGDNILAVIRGSAVNQDGRSNGLTAPNGPAQEAVLRAALEDAGLEGPQIDYVEAHGTGTALGDPIEVMALGSVLGEGRKAGAPLLIGSAKTNVGHLESASGMAGLIKAVQILRHRQIPPSLNYETPNARIPFDALNIKVSTDLTPWPTEQAFHVGVSGFGFGGTNAHVVLAAAPHPASARETTTPLILPLSAPFRDGVVTLARDHLSALAELDPALLPDYCYAAATRRSQYDHRAVAIGSTLKELCSALERIAQAGPDSDHTIIGRRPVSGCDELMLSFSGQVDWAPQVAQWLLRLSPSFRDDPEFSAPLTVALSLAAADLFERTGVTATDVSGRGLGEISAACVAGVFSREEALSLALDWERALAGTEPFTPAAVPSAIPGLPFISHTLGKVIDGETIGPEHWQAVWDRRDAPQEAADMARAEIEIGADFDPLTALAALYRSGFDIDWFPLFPDGLVYRPIVPLTPFNRQRYWLGLPGNQHFTAATPPHGMHELERLPTATPIWEIRVDTSATSPAGCHRLGKDTVLPLGIALAVTAEAAAKELDTEAVSLRQVTFHQLITTGLTDEMRLQVSFGPKKSLELHVADPTANERDPIWLRWMSATAESETGRPSDLGQIRAGLGQTRPESLTRLQAQTGTGEDRLQAFTRRLTEEIEGFGTLAEAPHTSAVPAVIDRVCVRSPQTNWSEEGWVYLGLTGETDTGDLTIWTLDGEAVCELTGILFHPLPTSARPVTKLVYRLAWQEVSMARPNMAQMLAKVSVTDQILARQTETFTQELDPVSAKAILTALHSLGWNPEIGEKVTVDILTTHCGILPAHKRLIGRFLDILTEDGILSTTVEGWTVTKTPILGNVADEITRLRVDFPQFAAELDLLALCAPALADVLTGRKEAVDLLFRNGGEAILERLYGAAHSMQGANRVAADLVAAGQPKSGRYRILEIGGGTGGTTSHLLKRLADQPVEYVFTDISPAFLSTAEDRFAPLLGKEGSFTTQLLDIERDPLAQGFTAQGFDLVIAVNVLHATQNLSVTLTNVKTLLSASGHLIAVEQTTRRRLLDLSFGLTDGWWRFTDAEQRDFYPTLSLDRWHGVLRHAGFKPVSIEDTPAIGGGQGLLLAERQTEDARVANIRDEITPNVLAAYLDQHQDQDQDQEPIATVLHWVPATNSDMACAIKVQTQGLLKTIQTLAGRPQPPRLYVITQSAVAALPDDTPDPVAAALWGIGRTAALEIPEIWGGLIDLDGKEASQAALTLALQNGGLPAETAIRDGILHTVSLQPTTVAEPACCPITGAGSYLITGGLGSLGLATADWLVRKGAAHLVLCSRRPAEGAVQERINGLGVPVEVVRMDVSDRTTLSVLLARFGKDLPALAGIFHTAGITADVMLRDAKADTMAEVCRAKPIAATTLLELTEGMALDFVALYSSASAVFGQTGSGLYTGANAAMDAVAALACKQGRRVVSLQWGPWSGTKMSESVDPAQKRRWKAIGLTPLAPETALHALEQGLTQSEPNLTVIDADWRKWANQPSTRSELIAGLLKFEAKQTPPAARTGELGGVLKALTEAHAGDRRRRLETYLQSLLSQVLIIPQGDEIGAEDGFQELGLDSLSALTLLDLLQRDTGIRLPATALFDHPNIRALGMVLDQLLVPTNAPDVKPAHPKPAAPNIPASDIVVGLDELAAWNDLSSQFGA
ncbi:SDR family NAD(P)-dependent oxidoreductase [Rhodospirillum sp. A1_3_36]|uniref:SDR family NAD(P)-dependent oxidoreductase n=1 Tax=Rhodospirillum sp. A1_3_36 TaxID=3391666 RepID=UPI0039A53674